MKPEPSSEAFWLDQRPHLAIILPFLTLFTPFVAYLMKRDYPPMSPEILLILAGILCVSTMIGLLRYAGGRRVYAMTVGGFLAAAADYLIAWVAQSRTITLLVIFGVLVVLVRRFEKTATLVITAFLCVFVISTVLLNGFEKESDPASAISHVDVGTDGPPRLIHLILDEHLGIEGMPNDTEYAKALKHKIKQFYQRYGFDLYGGAYSHYLDTEDSIPNLVNFSAEGVNLAFSTGDRPPYVLQQNRYFQFLKSLDYRIHVMHGDYIDFCSSPGVELHSCTKSGWFSLSNVARLDIPVLTKTTTAIAAFVTSYPRYEAILDVYEERIRPALLLRGVVGPVLDRQSLWTKRRVHPFSVNAMVAMETLSARIQQLPRGHMLFAHLMIPHFPYVYREDCSPRAISESMDDMEQVPLELRTTEDRATRYDQYLRQIGCLYVKLDEVFQSLQSSGVLGDSIVIIHGDHGGRLGLRLPAAKEQDELTPIDFGDGLSTLFAAKVPGKPGEYDSSLYAINELLVDTLRTALGKAPSLSPPQKAPFAYLANGHRKHMLLVDMPWRPLDIPNSHAPGRQPSHSRLGNIPRH